MSQKALGTNQCYFNTGSFYYFFIKSKGIEFISVVIYVKSLELGKHFFAKKGKTCSVDNHLKSPAIFGPKKGKWIHNSKQNLSA